ncbi:MAG: ABC transporter permease, partial [Gemmatimonadaceae bacterium]
MVSPSYVRTMGWRIIKGRDFLDGERDHGAVIVDEQTVKVLWPNENPIGALIKFGDRNSARPYVRVVGVMGDAEQFKRPPQFGPSTQTIRAIGKIFYLPGPSDTLADGMSRSWVTFIARGTKRPEELPVAIRHALQS